MKGQSEGRRCSFALRDILARDLGVGIDEQRHAGQGDVNLGPHELRRQAWEPIQLALGKACLVRDVSPLDTAELAQALAEWAGWQTIGHPSTSEQVTESKFLRAGLRGGQRGSGGQGIIEHGHGLVERGTVLLEVLRSLGSRPIRTASGDCRVDRKNCAAEAAPPRRSASC